MMIKVYDDLTPQEQDELSNAWLKICEGLEVYARVTGADSLDDIVYDELWDAIAAQQLDC